MRKITFKCDKCGKEQEVDHRQAPYDWYTQGYFHNGLFNALRNYCPDCGPTITDIAENEEKRRQGGIFRPIKNMFRRRYER